MEDISSAVASLQIQAKGAESVEAEAQIVTREMARYCFDVLLSSLMQLRSPGTPEFTNDPYPLFVTWSKGKGQDLRGCVGTFQALPLHEGLRDYALASAFRDSRFKPITKEDLGQLHVSVSVLHDFEDGAHYLDWTLGGHGIRISFKIERDSKTATFLPEIALREGWTKLQTIDALLKKGGFTGKVTREVRQGVKLVRYKSQKISMSYNEYVKADVEGPSSRRNSTRLA